MAATLGTLRARVLGMLNDPNAERYSPTLVNSTINQVMQYYARAVNSNYQGYLIDQVDVNLVADQRVYALGATFRSPIYQVRRTINQVNYFLDPFQPYNLLISTVAVPNSAWLPRYWLEGNSIAFEYAPNQSETAGVRVTFQKKIADLAADGSALDDQLYDAEDCICLRTTVRQLRSKDVSGAFKNVTGWTDELAQAEANFFTQVGNRYVKPDKPIPVADSLWGY